MASADRQSRRLLVTRPQPEIDRTVGAAHAAGWETIAAPLLAIEPLPWEPPETDFDALLLTSPQGARHGWPLPARLATLPVYAVGERTAEVAKAQGFRVACTGDSDGSAIVARAVDAGVRRLLQLRGEDGARLLLPPELLLEVRKVYRAVAAPTLPAHVAAELGLGSIFATLLFSPRSAAIFASLVERAGIDRANQRLVALSPAVAAAAGPGWKDCIVTQGPSLDAAVASAETLWQKHLYG